MKEYKEGYYHLWTETESYPVLVHGYYCADMGGEFVLGFNCYDGGSLLPIKDLTCSSKIIPVTVTEKS